MPGVVHHLDLASLLVVQVAGESLEHDAREAKDRVERRAELVAHVRKEFASGSERLVQPDDGRFQTAIGLAQLSARLTEFERPPPRSFVGPLQFREDVDAEERSCPDGRDPGYLGETRR